MKKYSVVFLPLLLILGCENVDKSMSLEDTSVNRSSAKNKPCQMSPPIIQHEKLITMLIKSGVIKETDSKEEQYRKLDAYIQNKNARGSVCKK